MTKKFTQLTAATVLADDDQYALVQNYSTTPILRRTPFSLIKSTLKTYFDSLYASISGYAILPISIVDGLTLSNNVSDANNDIDIAPGKVVDSGGTENMILSLSLTKRLDASWTVGSNQGGLDTGTKAINTWYHVWLIKRTDTGVVDVLFSTSGTTPTMPSGYTKKHRLLSVRTDGSGNILPFSQNGDEVLWSNISTDLSAEASSATAGLKTILVPSGIKVNAILALRSVYSASSVNVLITSPDQADQAPTSTLATLAVSSAVAFASTMMNVRTNTSSQVRLRSSGTGATNTILTSGWVDPRGKW